jgi:hypothetical protein
MPCADRSAAIKSAWAGGTTGSSSPCSSRIGQVAALTWPTGARSTYSSSLAGSGPIRPSRYRDSKSWVWAANPRRSVTP